MRKLRFKGQVYAGFVISIVIITATAFFFYNRINRAIEDNRAWMQSSVDALALLDSIAWLNSNATFEMLTYISDDDTKHLAQAKDEHAAITANLVILTEHMQQMGMGTLVINYLHTLIDRRDGKLALYSDPDGTNRPGLAEVQSDSRQIGQQLYHLKQAIIAKRRAQMEIQNQVIIHTKYAAVVGLAAAILVLLGLIGYITKTFDFQKRAEILVRKTNADLNRLSKEKEIDNWILSGLAALEDKIRGGLNEKQIAANAIQTVCQYLNAKVGIIYLKSTAHDDVFIHAGSYAIGDQGLPSKIMGSQGLLGESLASRKPIVLSDIPEGYLTIASALGNSKPENIVIQPFVYEDEVLGVMEIGFFRSIDDAILQFLEQAGVNIAVASKVAYTHSTLSRLYEETQQQAEELEAQQEELRTTNDELIHKTHLLEASEEELRVQQEELRHANVELEEKARLLEERNFSIEQARQSIAMKANELEQSGRYKSEFLANMSHELRTPLNSILILAKLLEDNKSGNLLPDQVKYAAVIHRAGTDLLNLINNILDLSKIESGKVELMIEDTLLSNISQDLLELFNSIADSKAIDFRVAIHDGLPPTIATDEQRLQQILKNLLSNAFKFTKEKGRVELQITMADQSPAWKVGMLGGIQPDEAIAFSVIDTGIGIPSDKQGLIFDAFKQADGSTSRKFGGTGLGLSICRELATLLGGDIQLVSEEGQGSTFTLFLPLRYIRDATTALPEKEIHEEQHDEQAVAPPQLGTSAPKRLLIIEDDQNFAEILELYAREHGFETLVAHQGDLGLQMAFEYLPDAIILDIMLPVMDGWTVLKKLKSNPETKEIPVHLMSADRPSKRKIEGEAVGFLKKPVDKKSLEDVFGLLHRLIKSPLKRVLVIEDQKIQSDSLKSSLAENGADVGQAFTAAEALESLAAGEGYDCIILDINLPDKSGMDLLDDIKHMPQHADTPVIINTAMDLSPEMTTRILRHAKTMVVKSDKSNNRILDEVNLFINKIKNDSPSAHRLRAFDDFASKELRLDNALEGKCVLLADDDMRNIFALSTVFASHNIKVETANNGVEALDALRKNPQIDLVLMDIMMPEMDGYEAMAKIRATKKFAKLPIIAITAKAMQGDRQRALDSGANDYIAKPVDINKLLSLMRVWLS